MKIYNNHCLKEHNTFRMDVSCRYFIEIENVDELKQVLSDKVFTHLPKLIIGGGSNILFTKDYDGIVINQISNRIKIISEDDTHAYISAEAGVIWHDLVLFCINKNFGGIENLSLIPGKVGAGPIQNIGAYGQELSEVFHSLQGIFTDDLRENYFSKSECSFGYRESIFKKELKNKFVITEVTLRLNKNPILRTGYGDINAELSKLNKFDLTIKDISDVVCKIRTSKLPNSANYGNAGSFFKNPEIISKKYKLLKEKYTDLPGYKVSEYNYKLPAGWLIEKCGFKGVKIGNVGVHEKQALVIVNYGNAKPDEIIELKNKIASEVKSKFDIELQEEVNII